MTRVNVVLFGVGNVGSTLIHQILDIKQQLEKSGEIEINLPVVVNSTIAFFEKKGVTSSWQADFENFGFPYCAGAAVTARGVLSDILKLAEKLA